MARLSSDIASGILVAAIGILGLAASADLDRGTLYRMGPGFLPNALSWLIVGGGVLLLARGLLRRSDPIPEFAVRPLAMICIAIAVFGLAIDTLGMMIAVAALIVISSFAGTITRHRETPVLAAGLAIGATLVFVQALGLAIPIWPR